MTITKSLSLFALAAALFIASPARAESDGPGDGPKGDKKPPFERVDTDGDGFVTKDEMLTAHKDRVDRMFSESDTDKDGKLSREEMKAGHQKMREKMKERFEDRRERLQDRQEQ